MPSETEPPELEPPETEYPEVEPSEIEPSEFRTSASGARHPIRLARTDEVETLRDIEREAGRLFREAGMAMVADEEPMPAELLRAAVDAGRVWVIELDGRPGGYILVEEVDAAAHIEQVSVHPDLGRRGYGRALIEHVAGWAKRRGYPALTLTTYVDVPWNGPFYLRLGFGFLDDADVTPGLRAVREEEIRRGLDRWPRACMRRDLG